MLALEGDELVVRSLDASGTQSEVARAKLFGKDHRSLVAFRGPEGELLATIASTPKPALQFYKLAGDAELQAVGSIDLGNFEAASVVAAGDLDGDGRDELVLFVRVPNEPFQRPRVLVLLDPLGKVRAVPLDDKVGVCDGYEVAFARLSGLAAPASLIVNASKWQGFRLHVFDASGGGIAETFHRALGEPMGLRVVREGDRDYALVGANREQFSDAAPELDASPDLGSDTPDAIWRLSRREGSGCDLEPLHTRPFADRLTGWIRLLAVGVVPGYRKAFVAHQSGPELRGGRSAEQVVFVLPEPGLPPVWVGLGPDGCFTSLGALPDLDGDGEPEITLGTPRGLVLSFSSGRAPPPPKVDERPPAEASPLDVGLDLLACGEPAEACAQLEALIARPETNASDRSRASLARERSEAFVSGRAMSASSCAHASAGSPQARRSSPTSSGLASAGGRSSTFGGGGARPLEKLRTSPLGVPSVISGSPSPSRSGRAPSDVKHPSGPSPTQTGGSPGPSSAGDARPNRSSSSFPSPDCLPSGWGSVPMGASRHSELSRTSTATESPRSRSERPGGSS